MVCVYYLYFKKTGLGLRGDNNNWKQIIISRSWTLDCKLRMKPGKYRLLGEPTTKAILKIVIYPVKK